MLSLDEPIILYHGSVEAVEVPDLIRCRPRKDFGCGFYLTSSRRQAEDFAKTVTRRANRRHMDVTQGYGVLSSYMFDPSYDLQVKVFPTADADWLHCVAAHRGAKAFEKLIETYKSCDAILGKVANDQTNATILAYIGGIYGETGSRVADETCIRLLIPQRLDNQVCLRTNKALSCLEFLQSERIWL